MSDNFKIPFQVNDEKITNREEKSEKAEILIVLNGISDALSSIADSLVKLQTTKK